MSDIEKYLLARPTWVPAAELASAFDVHERELRARSTNEGMCSAFAISGNKGFMHVKHATAAEWQDFDERLSSHGLSELTRVARLRDLRNHYLNAAAPDPVPAQTFDPTGQGQLLA